MTESDSNFVTTPIEPSDTERGFSCGVHALDDYFARHALSNDPAGIGRAYVLRRDPAASDALPFVLGFYTLSMAVAEAALVGEVLDQRLPKYPMPVALIGRLAVDKRTISQRSPTKNGRGGCSCRSLWHARRLPTNEVVVPARERKAAKEGAEVAPDEMEGDID